MLSVFLSGLAALSQFARKLLFACDRRWFERLASPRFGNDAFVLNAPRETSEHRLKALALSVFYLYQLNSLLLWSNPIRIFAIGFHLPYE